MSKRPLDSDSDDDYLPVKKAKTNPDIPILPISTSRHPAAGIKRPKLSDRADEREKSADPPPIPVDPALLQKVRYPENKKYMTEWLSSEAKWKDRIGQGWVPTKTLGAGAGGAATLVSASIIFEEFF